MLSTLRHLPLFLHAADAGSFAAAAYRSGLTPSAVSKAISAIEDELGARLFMRSRHGITLTPEGENFLHHARLVARTLEQVREGVRPEQSKVSGRLRVILYHAVGRSFLGPLLPRFMAQYPQVELECAVVDGYSDLQESDVDVALLTGDPPAVPGLVSKRLWHEDMVTCASSNYWQRMGTPSSPDELRSHRLLVLVRGDGRLALPWTFQQAREQMNVRARPVLCLNDAHALSRAALAGEGVIHFPRIAMKHFLNEGKLVTVFDDWYSPYRPITLLVAPGRKREPRVRAFISFVEAQVSREVGARMPPPWFDSSRVVPMVKVKAKPVFPVVQ
jgi:LysR family transcriptional regulator, regulator for bpeEF and oprC